MFWQEDEDKTLPWQAPDEVVDVSFAISCKQLPQDHAWALSQGVIQVLPWFAEDRISGLHTIHVAESGNGWLRPEDDNQPLMLSRRTRLILRIPQQRLNDTLALTGNTLDIDGYPMVIAQGKERPLINTSVIFSRYVLSRPDEAEQDFLQRIAIEVHDLTRFKVKKMLCGKSHLIKTPQGPLHTRHLMIADLDSETSIRIQQYGLGQGRKVGCGLFLPHKGIKTLKPTE